MNDVFENVYFMLYSVPHKFHPNFALRKFLRCLSSYFFGSPSMSPFHIINFQTESSRQEIDQKLTSAARLSPNAEETCRPSPAMSTTEHLWQETATVSSASQQHEGVDETSDQNNSDEKSTGNANMSLHFLIISY